jgi:hypothetical protein
MVNYFEKIIALPSFTCDASGLGKPCRNAPPNR